MLSDPKEVQCSQYKDFPLGTSKTKGALHGALGQCRRRLSHKFWGGAASTPGHSIKKEKQSTRSVKNGKRMRIHIHMCLFLHEESTRRVKLLGDVWGLGSEWV